MVAGSLESEDCALYPLHHGCRELFNHRIVVPENISRVSVSSVVAGSFSYVSGTSLTSLGQTITLGHMGAPDEQQHTEHNSAQLTGFNIAAGVGGIHAIQCVVQHGSSFGEWLGSTDKGIITARLASKNPIKGLRFGFDASGFRLVTVGTTNKRGDGDSEDNSALKKSGLWYPHVPPDPVELNGDYYFPLKTYLAGFKPMFWTQFGGPRGIYLKHLTAISLYDKRRLAFKYDNTPDIPDNYKTFGRALKSSPQYQTTVRLDIDGPGNERIESITIRQKFMTNVDGRLKAGGVLLTDGLLASFEIKTNLGRSCYFPVYDELEPGWAMRPALVFKVKEGMPITGFYGAQFRSMGRIAALGLMTESEN
ncbi:hypothetical protein QBC40DRAFT_171062 [Triangularia verruculosa]|uniref:DUF7600 domain-containing protein n=1 Tax=Triangularia verruculosa TaxID=2587418 RepID=A0AAN6XK12_9PEZI|nr:hypothetical protein QBC40DRAFT_171062 [Triangularia verruculosa]